MPGENISGVLKMETGNRPRKNPVLENRNTPLISSYFIPLMPKGLPRLSIILSVLLLSVSCASRSGSQGIVIILEKRIPSLDPRVSGDSAAERFRQLVFNGLTRKNEKFEAIPDLAENIQVSEDRRTHTFRIRQGVRFHDGCVLAL